MSVVKVLVIGESATGKTALVSRIVDNSFNEQYKATIGCEFGFKVVDMDGESVRVQLWDLAGQDRLGGMSRLYCRDADGAMVVADLTRETTIFQAWKWKSQVDEYVRSSSGLPIPMLLCLNKSDLVSLPPSVLSQYETEAVSHHFLRSIATSAKTGSRTNEALRSLLRSILPAKTQPTEEVGVKLEKEKKRGKCLCGE